MDQFQSFNIHCYSSGVERKLSLTKRPNVLLESLVEVSNSHVIKIKNIVKNAVILSYAFKRCFAYSAGYYVFP